EPLYMIEHIDENLAKQSGLPKPLTGEAPTGTRSGEQQMVQAQFAAGPTQKRAMYVEEWLEGLATALLELPRRTMGKTLVKADGSEYLLAQMPDELTARVWAHSQSPLYAREIQAKAKLAKEAGALDNEDFLVFLDLPETENKLRKKAQELARAQAET